jgi:hypothetical protein
VNTSGDLATTGDIGAGGDITAVGNVSSGSVSTGSLSTTGGITSAGDVSVTGVGGKVSATNGEFRRLHLLDDQATPHYVEVRSPDPLTANYTLTLPGSLGSSNQILGMNNAGSALENKTLTAGSGVTITHSAGGITIAASGSGGTVTSVTGTANEITVGGTATDPVIGLGDLAASPAGTYGSSTQVPTITVDAKGRVTSASSTTISGVSPVGSNLATGKAWIGDGTGKAAEAYINVSDLKKSDGTPQIPSTCTASQTMTWSSVTDVFTCSNITITKSQVSDFPTLGTAALEDVGTNAGDVVQLDGSGKLPAVDGSQLTNLTLPSYDTTYFKQGGNDFSATATLGTTGNNDLNIITNNTTKMTVLANGNVGIGTTSPFSRLELGGQNLSESRIYTTLYSPDTNAPGLISRKARGDFNTPSGVLTGDYLAAFGGRGYHSGGAFSASTVGAVMVQAAEDFTLTNQGTNVVIHTTNTGSATASEKMRVSASGNVGIGTTVPVSQLHISGGGTGLTLDAFANAGQANGNGILLTGRRAGGTASTPSATRSGSTLLGLMGEGHDGSGFSSSYSAIINMSAAEDFTSTAQGSRMTFSTTPTGSITPTERLRIDPNGNIGVGTNSPSVSLDIGTKTDAIRLPAGTTAQQPAAPANGMIRYNSSNNKFEAYENSGWVNMIGGTASSASSVSAGVGSAGSPSISFSGDSDTGFYSNGTNSIGISAGGANIFNFTSNGLISPTAGGALLKTGNGTAAAPTFSFAGDTDTGWYLAAPDTLAASTGGSERVRIDASGSVGIGTTSPAAKIEVVGNGTAPALLMSNVNTNNTAKQGLFGTKHYDTSQLPFYAFQAYTDATHNNAYVGGSTAYGNAATDVIFVTAANNTTPIGTERMRIDSSGNVGIGTAVPGSPLDVAGEVRGNVFYSTANLPINGGANFVMSRSNNTKQTYIAYMNASAQQFLIGQPSTSDNLRFESQAGGNFVFTGGNVGIGTTGSTAKLHVKNDTQVPAILERNQSGTQSALLIYQPNTTDGNSLDISMRSDTTGTGAQTNVDFGAIRGIAAIHDHSTRAGYWAFTTANGGSPTEKMRITANGNVGIGTNDPGQKLHIQGTDGVVGILVENTDSTAARWPSVTVRNYQGSPANTGFPAYHLEASRGSKASPLPVAQGDNLGSLQFWGTRDVAGTKIRGAFINAIAKENFTSSTGATDMTFATNPTGSTDASTHEQMRITSEGDVGIGTTNPKAKLEVAGSAVIGTGRGAKTIGVVSYFTTTSDSASYIHIKTPFRPAVTNGMYHFKVEGYAYDDAKDIDLTFVGYSYTVTPTVIQSPGSRDPSGIYNPTQYIGSDGYIYLRFKPSNLYYTSFRVDSMYVGNGRIIYPGEMSVIVSTSPTL